MSELRECPFCGCQPTFSEVEEKDDRRYMEMRLECCATMRSTICYSSFKSMTDAAIESELRHDLVNDWNRRAPVPQEAQQPVAWMTADGRVATDETKQIMPNASKVVFNIPLYDHRKE